MSANVLFKLKTRAAFNELAVKQPNVFYRVTNTDSTEDLYIGDKKLNNAADIVAAIAALDSEIITSGTAGEGQVLATINSASGDTVVLTGVTQADGTLTAATAVTIKAVAVTGKAEDLEIDDDEGRFTSTNVEGALTELARASSGGVASKTVYMTSEGASADYSGTYKFYQGTGSAAAPVASELVGQINLAKDMVATAGELVTVTSAGRVINQADVDITSSVTGIIPTVSSDALYVMFSIAHGDQFFVAVQGLIDIYQGSADVGTVGSGVAISVSNGVISATIVSIDGSDLVAGSVAKAKLNAAVQASLGLADSAVQSITEGNTNGTVSVDGTDVPVHGLGSAAYTNSTAYDLAGSAAAAQTAAEAYADTVAANAVTTAEAYTDGLLTWEEDAATD
jgi:hypothetical protein